MPMYGFEIAAKRPGFEGRAILRKEFEAAEASNARLMIKGWLAIEGYDVDASDVRLMAEGKSFREEGKQRAMNIAAELSLRYGAAVEGPYDDDPGSSVVVRVVMPDGKGISLATDGPSLYDPAPCIEALAFTEGGWVGAPERNVDVNRAAEMLEKLLNRG